MSASTEDFSVVVLASDVGVEARPFLLHQQPEEESWHDCSDEDFSDLEQLPFFTLQGSDKNANRIHRIFGKYYPVNRVGIARALAERIEMAVAQNKEADREDCGAVLAASFCGLIVSVVDASVSVGHLVVVTLKPLFGVFRPVP